MPVPEVEAGLPSAATVDLLTLAAVDEGQSWAFPTLRAWTNVAGRRGYLLDGFADWLAARGAAEGDSLSFYRDSDASPPVSCGSCAAVGLDCADCVALLLAGSVGLNSLLPAWHEREAVAATAGQAAAALGSAPSTAAPQPHMQCSPNLRPSSCPCAACGGARSRRLSAPPPCGPRALGPHLGLPAAAAASQGARAAASTWRHPRPRRGAPEPPAQRRQLCVPPHYHLHQASRPPRLLQRSQGLQAARIADSLLGAGPPTLRQVCV